MSLLVSHVLRSRCAIDRDSPDELRTGVDDSDLLGSGEAVLGGVDDKQHCGRLWGRQMAFSGHLPSIWAHSPMVVLERMSIERLTLALVATAAAVAR